MSLLILGKESETYAKWESFNLSAENNNMLFIPKGFAHGFLVLSEKAIINYKVDNYFDLNLDAGINYNDSKLDIDWNLSNDDIIVSDKDKKLPNLIVMKIIEKDLTKFSTIRTKSYAKYFCMINNLSDLKAAFKFKSDNNLKYVVLGNGSNLLFSKDRYDDIVFIKLIW